VSARGGADGAAAVVVAQPGTALPTELPEPEGPGRDSNPRPVDEESITGAVPARSREVRRGHEMQSGRGVEPQRRTIVQPPSPDNRAASARDDLVVVGAGPPGLEPGPARLELAVLPLTPQASAEQTTRQGALPLSRSLRQELNPHLGRTKGACLPLTLRRRRWRRSESNRHLPRCKRGARPVELHPRAGDEVRTGGVEPPQREAAGLQPAELAVAQRPHELRVAGRVRTGAGGVHNPGCFRLHHGHHERGRPDSNRRPLA
jgi:hypothetical protein